MAPPDLFSSNSNAVSIGIDISSSTAVFMVLRNSDSGVTDITGDVKKISMEDDESSADIQKMHEELHAHFDAIKPQKIGILRRSRKGKFAASAASFKVEAMIQNYKGLDVEIISGPTVKAFLKKNPLPFAPKHKYQEKAFGMAWYLLRKG